MERRRAVGARRNFRPCNVWNVRARRWSARRCNVCLWATQRRPEGCYGLRWICMQHPRPGLCGAWWRWCQGRQMPSLKAWRRLSNEPRLGAVLNGVGASVDGPSDASGKVRILTGGSIAIMRPALLRRLRDRWPQMVSAIQTQTRRRRRKPVHQTASLDRRFDRSSSHSALSPYLKYHAWFRPPPADAGRFCQ